jgi:hypothetical protein
MRSETRRTLEVFLSKVKEIEQEGFAAFYNNGGPEYTGGGIVYAYQPTKRRVNESASALSAWGRRNLPSISS